MVVSTENLSKEYDGIYRVNDLDIQINTDIVGGLHEPYKGMACESPRRDFGHTHVGGYTPEYLFFAFEESEFTLFVGLRRTEGVFHHGGQ